MRSVMIAKVKAAAAKIHPMCEVTMANGVIEVALPEDCGLVWLATEGTMLVIDAERSGSIAAAYRDVIADIKWGVRATV